MVAARRSPSERDRSFEHFLFDLDGTIVDSSDDLVGATNFALRDLGLAELPREVVLGFVGRGVRRLIAASLERAAPDRVGELTEPALARFRDFYGAHLLDRTRPYPDMEATLRELHRRGARLSLLTNKPRGFSAAILDGLGLARLFRAMVCGDDDLPRKPDPAGALALVRESGVPAEATLLVGDSTIDLETARAARLASCAVTWGFRPPEELSAASPDWLARVPRDLLDLAPAASR